MASNLTNQRVSPASASAPQTDAQEAGAWEATEKFVYDFQAVWLNPTVESLNNLLHPEVRLIQPMEPVAVGLEGAARLWRRLLRQIPDVRIEVLHWSSRD